MTTDVPRASSQQSIPTFVTDHLALAAYLASRGHLVTLVPTRSGKILFSFGQTDALSTDAVAFSDGSGQVAPATYDAARIRLRRQMDALKGGVV